MLAAYLMRAHGLWPAGALALIRRTRPFVAPNAGFAAQLALFHRASALDDQAEYRRWEYAREGPAPQRLNFRDAEGGAPGPVTLRCRRCRRALADSRFFAAHGGARCAHRWVEPLAWMGGELARGAATGRLECPKCRCKVGSYAWRGMQCSCGEWVVPALSLARGKVDEGRT